MLTKTSISAIRALTYLGRSGSDGPVSPRHVAEKLGESPTYRAKVVRHLVKSSILRAHRGMAGGVTFGRAPEETTLLSIVEACQGAILADFCEEAEDLAKTCALHQAGAELHRAVVGVLSRWNLAQLIENEQVLVAEIERAHRSSTDDPEAARLLEGMLAGERENLKQLQDLIAR